MTDAALVIAYTIILGGLAGAIGGLLAGWLRASSTRALLRGQADTTRAPPGAPAPEIVGRSRINA